MKKCRDYGRYMIDWTKLDVPANSVTEEFFQYGMVYDIDDIQEVELGVWFDAGGGWCHECCFVSERFGGVLAVIWED